MVKLAFARVAVQTQANNRVLMTQGLRLCTLAAAEGLDLIPLKGAALNLGMPYSDMGLRPMVDLDLLARPAQIPELARLFDRQGYREVFDRQTARRYSHHLIFKKTVECIPVKVELHWSPFLFMYGKPRADAAVFRRSHVHHHEEAALRILDPHDMLLSVLLHFSVHRFRGQLKWLVDISELAILHSDEIDWEKIWATAHELQGRRAAAFAAHLARELLGAPVPSVTSSPLGLFLLGVLSRRSDVITSRSQPPWVQSALVNILQYDSPWPAARFLYYKAAELVERFGGITVPRLLARRDSLGPLDR